MTFVKIQIIVIWTYEINPSRKGHAFKAWLFYYNHIRIFLH